MPALANGYITFGCLNNFCKVNDGVCSFGAVLRAVPQSRLSLLAQEGSHRQRTCAILARHGITGDRINFFSRGLRSEYLALNHSIDIGLDTLPYNGHVTILDSFWMGVPVVTLVGETVVGLRWSERSVKSGTNGTGGKHSRRVHADSKWTGRRSATAQGVAGQFARPYEAIAFDGCRGFHARRRGGLPGDVAAMVAPNVPFSPGAKNRAARVVWKLSRHLQGGCHPGSLNQG